ncbi:hypothetical protein [Frankia sp. AgB32]|uniref:hypothetical protein n=1 Tax=Frankia sp. AgB32 TaxID=631119 RepID=UPI00200DC9F1|nr:hypothetical protein [Frankia sp. AgB32]MCK9898376.1 hypothetical protein [Frankia sp. AgB32]
MTRKAPGRIVGGQFLGLSRRVDGKVRANWLTDPATGQDRAVVKATRRAARATGRRSDAAER